ncbi:MAG: nucleoside hydrolase [Alphaproteobacteria bacterium]|nr:nucleoside hydrolase [Alphaproteobacteria bacterium]
MRRKIIIDCDPGIDDAVALMLACASPEELEILAVTAVAGNVALGHTAANARRVLEACDRGDVPVYAGCPRPLLRPPVTADRIHGETGIDGSGLPPPTRPLADGHAVDLLRDTVRNAPGEVTVVAVGPLTNLAAVLVQRPEFAAEAREIVVMGGSAGPGNVTPHAEFNFHADPHAARIVFESGASLAMYGLNITHQVRVDDQVLGRIAALRSPPARAAAGMLERYRDSGGALHDVLAVGHLLRPDCFGLEAALVTIDTSETGRIGRSIVERGSGTNARVGFDAAAGEFLDFLLERLARY